jgi:hypothetical protein
MERVVQKIGIFLDALYHEIMAKEIAESIPDYYTLLESIINRLCKLITTDK